MKKLAAVLAVSLMFLVGCGEGQPLGDPKPPADKSGDRVKVNGDADGNYTFETVTINGMECIILSNTTSYGHKVITFDCDWDKESN